MASEEDLMKMASDQATLEEIKSTISSDNVDRWKDTTKPELFKFLAKPDYQTLKTKLNKVEYVPTRDVSTGLNVMSPQHHITTISPFTKELKTSYLNKEKSPVSSIIYIMELTDLAHQMNELGASETAEFLFIFRDTILSAAPSMDAMFLKLTQTEYSMKKMDVQSKKRRLFSKSDESN
jgi:hypothetical protein